MDSEVTQFPESGPRRPLLRCRRVFLVALWCWCLIPLSPQGVDSDFWGHVQYGRDTWRHGLATTATYTYTAIDYPWVNHENLSELLFAGLVDGPGIASLLVLKCLLGGLVIAEGLRRCVRARLHPLPLLVLTAVAAWNLSSYWGLRPHMLSFALFAALIAWTDRCFAGWPAWSWSRRVPMRLGNNAETSRPQARPDQRGAAWAFAGPTAWPRDDARELEAGLRRLWLVPPLMMLWANTHGGFLAGLGVFLAIVVGRMAQLVLSGPLRYGHLLRHLLLLAPVTVLATFANPYGARLHAWLLYDVTTPRPEIAEWHPVNLGAADAAKIWLVLALLAWAWLGSRRPRDLVLGVVLSLVLVQSLAHQRHFPFLVILVLYWLPGHLQSAWERLGFSADLRRGRVGGWATNVASVGLVLAAALFASRVGERLTEVPVACSDYPVSAVQFLSQRGITGRMVVSGHWAQYVLSAVGARAADDSGVRVAFDGRHRTCYPQEVLDMQFDFFAGPGGPDQRYRSPQSPPADPRRILEFRRPELVLLGHHHQHALAVLAQAGSEWTLLYQDDLAQLWGRRAVFDRRGHARYLPRHQRPLQKLAQAGTVPWPAKPGPDTHTALVRLGLAPDERSRRGANSSPSGSAVRDEASRTRNATRDGDRGI